jgi:hypothetical protein
VTATAQRPATEAVFTWIYGHTGGIKPEVAASEVQAIYAAQGTVTPEAVVEVARPSDAPLHAAFEWDDTTAAEAYRENQARNLLAKLVVSYRKTDGSLTQPTRYLVKLQARPDEDAEDETLEAATQPHVYIPVRKVMEEEVLRRKYVREAYLSVVSWRRRYGNIEAFASVFEAIDAMGEDFGKPA